MQNSTRANIAERLNYLMQVNPDLSTNQKVETRAGVSKNTVRRLRLNEPVDVSLANVEAVAHAFGLTLAEFVSPPSKSAGMNADELVLRQLKNKKDKEEVLFFASSKAMLNKLMDEELPGSD